MTDHALLAGLSADLAAEQDALDGLIEQLATSDWSRPTRCPGWTVLDQIAHLAVSEAQAAYAVSAPEQFVAERDGRGSVDGGAASPVAQRGDDVDGVVERWRVERRALSDAIAAGDPAARIPWYGPPMSAASMLTARLMETWAHGTDIADAVGRQPIASPRLRHVAHLGVATRPHAYMIHGLEVPQDSVAVVLHVPDGSTWSAGDPASPSRVEGSMLDFCLVVTRRAHPDDTDLLASDAAARGWLDIAQAFAGPPADVPERRPSSWRPEL